MEESLICEGKLMIEESTNAIFKMRLNQSSGYDGPDFLIFKTNVNNFNCLCGKNIVSSFYSELIKTWIICNIKKSIKEPKQYFQVRKQIIWGNKFIKYKRKSLMLENWINSGIIFINDIIDGQGNISEVVILQNRICKQNWMSETSIVKNSPSQQNGNK
jgi:hypothetical protein